MDHEFRIKVGCQVENGDGPNDEQMIWLMNGEDVRIQIPHRPDVIVTITNLSLAVSHLTAVRNIVKRHEENEDDKPSKKSAADYAEDEDEDDEDFEGEHKW